MRCEACDATGTFRRDAMTIDGIKYPATVCECEECQGTGYVCEECRWPEHLCNCDQGITP